MNQEHHHNKRKFWNANQHLFLPGSFQYFAAMLMEMRSEKNLYVFHKVLPRYLIGGAE
jgi:hypothetical protein